MELGFFEITSPTLLDRLGVQRIDRNKSSQINEATKKLKQMGVRVYRAGKSFIIKEDELNERLEDIFNKPVAGSSNPKSDLGQRLADY